MIKILVVDDDSEKTRLIAKALATVSEVPHEISYAGDVVQARKELQGKGFDLLILDINLPLRRDQHAVADGGIALLRWLRGKGKLHRPPYIVGVTAYQESFEIATKDFQNFIWSVVRFSHSDSSWQARLQDTLLVLSEAEGPPYVSDGRTYKVDVGIVTALPRPELAAVLEIEADWKKVPVRHDASAYHMGRLKLNKHQLTVVATAASDKGLPGAAAAATKLIYSFRPRILVMVGISAGLRRRTRIGDVLIADPSWDWGSGKIKRKKGGEEEFHPAPYQLRIDETFRNAASRLDDDEQWRTRVYEAWDLAKPKQPFNVRVGPVASGASVLQDSAVVAKVLKEHKDLLGIEMEIFSLMFAASVAPMPRPKAITLKSVCDYGDGKKNNRYQAYAAYTAAKALHRFLLEIESEFPEAESSPSET